MNGMSFFLRIRSRVRKLPVLSHLTKGAFSLSRRWLDRFLTTGGIQFALCEVSFRPSLSILLARRQGCGNLRRTLFCNLCISLRIVFRGFARSIKTQNLSADQFFDIEIEKKHEFWKINDKRIAFSGIWQFWVVDENILPSGSIACVVLVTVIGLP